MVHLMSENDASKSLVQANLSLKFMEHNHMEQILYEMILNPNRMNVHSICRAHQWYGKFSY